MEKLPWLALLLAVSCCSAVPDCVDGNCTEPIPVISVDIGSIFPFFGPADIDSDESSFDEAIDPREPRVNASDKPVPQDDLISINFMEIFSFAGDDSDSQSKSELPGFKFIFEKDSIFDNFGVLDLSGKKMTGDILRSELRSRQLLGQPIISLVLSNSRIQGLTMASLQPVEETLQELRMDNCSVSLAALSRLSNLRLLNLSNTGLETFEWYPQLGDSLEVLDLSHNKLDEVRPELSVLTSLRQLYLSNNRITSVNQHPLVMLPNLEVISLTMNSLNNATFTSMLNLQLVELDWNYLRLCGDHKFGVQLPSHSVSVRLASNPWRCDCGILDARDNNDVLDIEHLECANQVSYAVCEGCQRNFLPLTDGRPVANLTKESIEHLGCTGLMDRVYQFRHGFVQLRDHEPEKLFHLFLMLAGVLLLALSFLLLRRQSRIRKDSWLKIQQIPYLKINKLNKPQEVPYIKIDTPDVKPLNI